MLYPSTSDYHWDRFDKNSSNQEIVGDWKKKEGMAQGPFGFGKAVSFKDEQVNLKKNFL